MGFLPIILASSLIFPRDNDQERSNGLGDPEKALEEVGPPRDDNEKERHLEEKDDIADDNESIQDSDADEEETDGSSSPGRRVTFGTTSVGSSLQPEGDLARPGLFAKLKAVIFPSRDESKPLSHHRILPVICGLVIPFSILLEISGLTDSWYIRTDHNVVVESRRNSAGYDAMLAISMFFAVAPNVSLICRFLEKGPVLITTLVTMASLTVHDAINIAVVVAFGVEHRFDDGFTYGHGYWMTVCSTSVSTATNISLIWDLTWTRNFTKSGSGVSRRQRSLLIIVMLLLVYIAFGALVNSLLIKLDFINGLYFTVVSIETVGFGDIVPDNTGARVFICFYIICGILNLGVAVGVARETIFEQLQNSYQKRLAKLRKKYQERRNWRIWERKWKRAVEWRLREINAEIWMPDFTEDSEATMDVTKEEPKRTIMLTISRIFHLRYKRHKRGNYFRDEGEIRGIAYGHPGTHLNVEALTRAHLEAAAVESGVPLCVIRALRRRRAYLSRTHTITSQSSASTTQYWRRWFWSEHEPLPTERPTTMFMRGLEDVSGMLTKFAIASTGVGMNRMPSWGRVEMDRQRSLTIDSSFSEATTLSSIPRPLIHDDFQEIANREERKAFWAKLVVAWSLFMVFWLVGAALFVATEKWTFGIAAYFCFVTFTTTGYGDFSPKSAAGRSLFVFWALLGLATMTVLVSVLQDAFSSKYKSAVHAGVFENAVKKYRQKMKSQHRRKAKEAVYQGTQNYVNIQPPSGEEPSTRAQRTLESLPGKILEQTRIFHRYIHHLVQGEPGTAASADLKPILDDISRVQRLDEKVKHEVLHDDDAKNMLCMLSVEKALRELIDIAEDAQSALAERDSYAVGQGGQRGVIEHEISEDYASGSGTCHHDVSHDSDST